MSRFILFSIILFMVSAAGNPDTPLLSKPTHSSSTPDKKRLAAIDTEVGKWMPLTKNQLPAISPETDQFLKSLRGENAWKREVCE